MLQLDVHVAAAPHRGGLGGFLFHATHHSLHGIGAGGGTRLVLVVGDAEGLSVEFLSVTIDVVGHVVVLRGLDAPAQIDTRAGLHSHQAAVELVGDALGTEGRDCQGGSQSPHHSFLFHSVSYLG